jgi:hypothetical protein
VEQAERQEAARLARLVEHDRPGHPHPRSTPDPITGGRLRAR